MADFGADGSRQQVLDDDPSELPTQMATFGAGPTEPDFAPKPWYKNRVLVGLWATAAILLLVLFVYGIVEISRGGGSGSTPTTTSSTRSSTSSSTTTPSTTAETQPPPEETPEQTPQEAPPQQGSNSPAPAPPTHRHHHFPHIPLPHF